MSTPIGNIEQILELPPGSRIVVRQDGGNDTVTWTKREDGSLSNAEATLPLAAFVGPVERGAVYLPEDHRLGQILTDETYYYKIIDQVDGTWVMVKTDSRGGARFTTIVKMEPLDFRDREDMRYNDHTSPAWDLGEAAYRGELAQARLDKILESGEVPAEETYTVSVEVVATMSVVPDKRTVQRLIGDNKITVTDVGGNDVTFTKTLAVEKSSRWGCACDQVVAADTDDVAGEVVSWSVVECAPKTKGKPSEVHAAA